MRLLPLVTLSTSLVLALLTTGCSSSFDPTLATGPTTSSIGSISGAVQGGRQPIVGAHVYLLQASTTAYGGRGIAASSSNASTSLLKAFSTGNYPTTIDGSGNYYVTTDANGAFGITGEYNACSTGDQVYLYSVGGNTGGGVANSAAGLMAVLGTCGSFGSGTTVNMNEVSTVAAAYAFAGFATDATHVGTSGSALAQVDITNAFANANQLFNIAASPYTTPNTVARATTPGTGTNGGTGTVPQKQVDTLANMLAACVNTTGPSSSQCSTLFTAVESLGTSGTEATDTATEAIYLAHNPTVNVSTAYGVTGITGAPNPYSPWFNSAAPPDFYIELTFTGGGLAASSEFPREIAIDASGNVWAVSGDTAVLSKLSPLGVPASSSGYVTGVGMKQPQAVAIDNQGAAAQVYVAEFASPTGAVDRFTASTGAFASQYTTGTNAGPADLAIDGSGNIWSANYSASGGTGNVGKQSSTGTGAAATFTNATLSQPTCISLEPGAAGSAYLADYNTNNAYVFTNAGSGSVIGSATGAGGNGNAIDSAGTIWYANYGSVSKVTAGGGSINTYTFGYNQNSIAIDGGNNVWVTNGNSNATSGAVFELANSNGAYLNTSSGHAVAAQPDSIAVDGSGDVWYNTNGDAALHELLGAAVPVATPLSYGVTASKLGQQP